MVSTQGQTPSGLDTESDAEKFTQLYHLYFQPLIWCVKKIVHSDTLAEEIVQETFQRLLRNLGKVDLNQPQKTKAYLVKIAVHIAYDVYSQELKYAPIDITSCQDTLITHFASLLDAQMDPPQAGFGAEEPERELPPE